MLDALIDREDGQIAGAGQAPMVVHGSQVAEHLRGAVGLHEYPIDKVGAGQLQALGRDAFGVVREQVPGVLPEEFGVVHVILRSIQIVCTPIIAGFARPVTGYSWRRKKRWLAAPSTPVLPTTEKVQPGWFDLFWSGGHRGWLGLWFRSGRLRLRFLFHLAAQLGQPLSQERCLGLGPGRPLA